VRPVLRGNNPQAADYGNYRDAFGDLTGRIGMFCSYCERRIATQLAVEHIRPKGLPAYAHLQGRWENFLLGCVNCNSTKKDRDVVLANVLLPDRDNTAAAYVYTMDGKITFSGQLTVAQLTMAERTLALTGLDKRASAVVDSNGQLVAIDRVAQRMEIWLIAQESKNDLQANPSDGFRRQIARTATGHGFFSIWMTVFSDDVAVRKLLIAEFRGTATDCFDANSTAFVSPRAPNGLANGSKI
jgi:uncharacterized protein (TIGR02646 family)